MLRCRWAAKLAELMLLRTMDGMGFITEGLESEVKRWQLKPQAGL